MIHLGAFYFYKSCSCYVAVRVLLQGCLPVIWKSSFIKVDNHPKFEISNSHSLTVKILDLQMSRHTRIDFLDLQMSRFSLCVLSSHFITCFLFCADSDAVRLISEVEQSISLLPVMVGSTNIQAEIALALQPLRSENVQLRRSATQRVYRILNLNYCCRKEYNTSIDMHVSVLQGCVCICIKAINFVTLWQTKALNRPFGCL